jgi:hypothetical protein
MKHRIQIIFVFASASFFTSNSFALEVDREVLPRITLGGRVLATLDSYDWDSAPTKEDEINIEDSLIMARFDKRMFEDGVAGGVIGIKEHDDKLVFNQMHVFFWNRDIETRLGRTRLQNTLIEFPTIREDDDFISYTHVGNASSNEEFDQKYGEQFSFDWFVDREAHAVSAWAGTRRNGTGITAPDGFDSMGLGWRYEQAEEYQYLKPIRHAGILLDRQKVSLGSGDEWMNAFITGIEFNLNERPDQNWSMAAQAIFNEGVGTITSADILHDNLDAVSNRARAESDALVLSIKYTRRPHLLTRWYAALNLAYKDYKQVNDAEQWSLAPVFMYRLGQGADLLGQLVYTDYGTGLGGGSDTSIQLGLSFSLESSFNENIGERNSIMNLEHGYIP